MPLEHAGVEVGRRANATRVATERGHRHQSPKAQGRLGRHLVDQIVEAGGATPPCRAQRRGRPDEDSEGVDAINLRQRTDQFGPIEGMDHIGHKRATAAALLLWSCPMKWTRGCASAVPLGRLGAQFLLLVLPDVGDP